MKNARVIYRRLEESLKKKSYINFNHRLVNSKDDLVEISSIFRDLRYETFRIIYLKGNRIVGYESISSRTPSLVQIFKRDKQGRVNVERCIYKILDRMNRLEADNYYLVHNHPSENAKSSIDDLRTTEFFAKKVNGFKGHLIVNTESYACISIDKSGNAVPENYLKINKRKLKNMTKQLKEKSIYDVKILCRDDLVSLMHHIKNSSDYSTAILTDAMGKVRLILDIPNHFTNMQETQIKGYFRNLARESGSVRVFFATQDNDTYKKAVKFQESGILKDCICYKDDSDKIYVYEKSDLKVKSDLFDDLKISDAQEEYTQENKNNEEELINSSVPRGKMRVLYKKVGENPVVKIINASLEAKQELVGGLIEVVPYEDVLIICNEEGKILNMPPNVVFDYDYIAGDFFVIGDDYEHGDFKSLTKDEIEYYKNDLSKRAFKYQKYKNWLEERKSPQQRQEERNL